MTGHERRNGSGLRRRHPVEGWRRWLAGWRAEASRPIATPSTGARRRRPAHAPRPVGSGPHDVRPGSDMPANCRSTLQAHAGGPQRRSRNMSRPTSRTWPQCALRRSGGLGCPRAGTNRAHNLPLEGHPRADSQARAVFNRAAGDLFVPRATRLRRRRAADARSARPGGREPPPRGAHATTGA